MSMSGAVCQRRAQDPTGRDAEQGGGNGDGETQAAAGESKGGTTAGTEDNTVTTGEGGDGEERGRQGPTNHST